MVATNPCASPPPKSKSVAVLVRSKNHMPITERITNNVVSTPTTDRIMNDEIIDTSATKPLSPETLARFREEVEIEKLNMDDDWITSINYDDEDE